MIILHLSFDKLTQHYYMDNMVNRDKFLHIGTASISLSVPQVLKERIDYIKEKNGDVIIWNLLRKTGFKRNNMFVPEAPLDFPKQLEELADAIVYVPTIIMASHGNNPKILKGSDSIKNIFPDLEGDNNGVS